MVDCFSHKQKPLGVVKMGLLYKIKNLYNSRQKILQFVLNCMWKKGAELKGKKDVW